MQFWDCPKPTIAAVHGFALAGGFEMALSCDLTIAAEGTRFGEPEVRFGSGIVALLLPWMTTPKLAKELLLTGNDQIDAQRALGMGIVNRVVPLGSELETARCEWDVINLQAGQAVFAATHDMLEKIDYSVVDGIFDFFMSPEEFTLPCTSSLGHRLSGHARRAKAPN